MLLGLWFVQIELGEQLSQAGSLGSVSHLTGILLGLLGGKPSLNGQSLPQPSEAVLVGFIVAVAMSELSRAALAPLPDLGKQGRFPGQAVRSVQNWHGCRWRLKMHGQSARDNSHHGTSAHLHEATDLVEGCPAVVMHKSAKQSATPVTMLAAYGVAPAADKHLSGRRLLAETRNIHGQVACAEPCACSYGCLCPALCRGVLLCSEEDPGVGCPISLTLGYLKGVLPDGIAAAWVAAVVRRAADLYIKRLLLLAAQQEREEEDEEGESHKLQGCRMGRAHQCHNSPLTICCWTSCYCLNAASKLQLELEVESRQHGTQSALTASILFLFIHGIPTHTAT